MKTSASTARLDRQGLASLTDDEMHAYLIAQLRQDRCWENHTLRVVYLLSCRLSEPESAIADRAATEATTTPHILIPSYPC